MVNSALLPARLRPSNNPPTSKPNWVNRQITPLFQSLSSRACSHPIHTVVFVALLASTSYIGLLEGSLFETPSSLGSSNRKAEWGSLIEGSKQLRVGRGTEWRWQLDDGHGSELEEVRFPKFSRTFADQAEKTTDHLALLTFVFPDSNSNSGPQIAPTSDMVPIPGNITAKSLPVTANPLASISQDSTLAFAVPYSEAAEFLSSVQEMPSIAHSSKSRPTRPEEEEKLWIMKAARGDGNSSRRNFLRWASNAWTEFVDLLKVGSSCRSISLN
jgi:hydroxymethylglutaryl-CoA reductase (NADPH)